MKKGSGGWKKVVEAFGEEILLDNGEINRPRLGQIVFADPDKRQFLNRYSKFMSWELHYITFDFIFVFTFEVSAVMVVLDCWLLIYPRGSFGKL